MRSFLGCLLGIVIFSMFFNSCKSKSQENTSSESKNPEVLKINELINNFNSTNLVLQNAFEDYKSIQSTIDGAVDKKEINEAEKQELSKLIDNKFVAYYNVFAKKVFKSTTWDSKDVEDISSISAYLSDNTKKTLTTNNQQDLTTVHRIVAENAKASALCKDVKFVSVDEASKVVAEVKIILADKDLRYNQPLMRELVNVPLELEKGHSQYIIQQINKLDNSNPNDKKQFDSKMDQIKNQIDSYNSVAKTLYGNNRYYPELMGAYRTLVNKYAYLAY